ncbi:MAG TPA: CRISPR-associated ring nuclease Csm6 [Paludibaculum sp.]
MTGTGQTKAPHEFEHRILVAVSGLSPQILTETLYWLSVRQEPRFIPTEVHLITTNEGASRARLCLLGEEQGWFERLRVEYDLPAMGFDDSSIHVIENQESAPLEDIRTPEDNLCAADAIIDLLRKLTADSECALHVSIAGGRKTLGFYAGYALSLLGRTQDRLSHVLAPAQYEGHPEFYYPTKRRRVIFTPPPDSRPLDTSAAEVTLAEIPFVPLREWIPACLLTNRLSFTAAVAAARHRMEPAEVRVNLPGGRLETYHASVDLPAAELAFFSWLARRRKTARACVSCPPDGAPDRDIALEYLREYEPLRTAGAAGDRTARALRGGMEKSFFLERKARLHRFLDKVLGPEAERYYVQAIGKRPETKYELGLEPGRIRFVELERLERRSRN